MRRGFTRNVVLLGVVSLLNDGASEMVVPLLPAFLATIGGGAIALGWIEGVADALASLLKLWSGRFADRVGRYRPLVLAGYTLAAIARPLVGLATTPLHVLAVRASDRTGKGLRTSPRDAMIAASVPADARATAFSFHRAMDHTGAVLGPLVAVTLLHYAGMDLRTIFLLSAVPGALVVLVLLFGVRELRRAEPPAAQVPLRETFRELRSLLVPIGVFTLGNASDVFLLLKAGAERAPLASLPLLWIGLHVVKVLFSLAAGPIADRLGRRRVLALGWIVYALVYAGFAFARGPIAVAALFVAYGAHHGLTEGVEKALVAERVSPERRGAAFGAYHLVVGVLAVPASVLFGVLWEVWSPRASFLVGAGLALVALPLLVFAKPTPPLAERHLD